jgi:hypothetical protein
MQLVVKDPISVRKSILYCGSFCHLFERLTALLTQGREVVVQTVDRQKICVIGTQEINFGLQTLLRH